MKVKAVTAYVDLGLTQRPSLDFHVLGQRLIRACGGRVTVFNEFPFESCWAARAFPGLPAANPRALDRFVTDKEHVRSNLIQHSPVQWVAKAYARDPFDTDVFVWMGYSLLKQGAFTGKPITEDHVSNFLDACEKYPFNDIPFPGILPRAPVNPHGDNWRFCGSTVIFPRRYLDRIVKSYFAKMRQFVHTYDAIPLDLAIWPEVERDSGLPWRFYKGEYDATQLTNFPG